MELERLAAVLEREDDELAKARDHHERRLERERAHGRVMLGGLMDQDDELAGGAISHLAVAGDPGGPDGRQLEDHAAHQLGLRRDLAEVGRQRRLDALEVGPIAGRALGEDLQRARREQLEQREEAGVAVREVPPDVRESARGMGMTGPQQFFRVELPLALPLVMSGIRLALVQVWATATIAALVAGPGLGRVITDGFFRSNYGKGIAGAIVVAVVALALELLAALVQRLADPTRRAGLSPNRDVGMSVVPSTVDKPVDAVG